LVKEAAPAVLRQASTPALITRRKRGELVV
jgi:hypothetical protein